MILDEVILEHLHKVQSKVQEKKGVNLSIEEIYNIIDFQFKMVPLAMSKNQDIQLPRLGNFIHTNKKDRYEKRKTTFEQIETLKLENPNYNAEKARKEAIINMAIETEENKKNKDKSVISGEELRLIEGTREPNIKILKSLYKVPVKNITK